MCVYFYSENVITRISILLSYSQFFLHVATSRGKIIFFDYGFDAVSFLGGIWGI
jgi:hypothetical protein